MQDDLTPEEFADAVRFVLGIVGEACIKQGLLPTVLLAHSKDEAAVLPCGPGMRKEEAAELLRKALEELDAGRVTLKPDPEAN